MPGAITLAGAPPDPGWRPLSLPGWRTDYLSWPPRADGEAGPPPAAIAALAAALGASAEALFLAHADPPGGARIIRTPWALRRHGTPSRIGLSCSHAPDVIATAFDQPGFDWTQRGQLLFLLPPGSDAGAVRPEEVTAAMQDDPPQRLPAACQGLLRPGTDGDFAELATRDPALRAAVLQALG